MKKTEQYKFTRNKEEKVIISPDLEEELFKRTKNQDVKAIEELMILYSKEVETMAREAHKMNNKVPLEDLIQQGYIGLFKAIQKNINAQTGSCDRLRFRGRARIDIKREIIKLFTREVKCISLDEYLEGKESTEDKAQSEDTMLDMLLYKDVRNEILKTSRLNNRRKFILIKRFNLDGNGVYTRDELANILGVCRQRIALMEISSLEHIRDIYKEKLEKEKELQERMQRRLKIEQKILKRRISYK